MKAKKHGLNTAKLLIIVLTLNIVSFLPCINYGKLVAQNIGINSTGAMPDASAMLDIVSDTKGLLIPRVALLSTTDVVTISSPATSLLVYNTNATMTGGGLGFFYWNGTYWDKFTSNHNSNAWLITGNAGTIDGTNFLGTTDNVPLNFRINNQKAGRIDQNGPTFLGYLAGNVNTGNMNTGIGSYALNLNTSGNLGTAIGWSALGKNTTGTANTAVGGSALYFNTTGEYNVAVGASALQDNTTGVYNVAVGTGALQFNTTADRNSAFGNAALYLNTTGISNTSTGYNSLYINATGSFNTANGYGALSSNTTGSLNTAMGYNANVSAGTFTNATAIGANALVSASNALILGSGVNVGIGTSAPNASAILDMTSTDKGLLIPRVTLSATNNNAPIGASIAASLLVYNTATAGVAPNDVTPGYYYWDGTSWKRFVTGSGSGWSLTGNAGTTAGTNFIGTTDAVDWVIKTNNSERMRVTSSGNVGIGVSTPTMSGVKLEVRDGVISQTKSVDANHCIQLRNIVNNTNWNLYQLSSSDATPKGFTFEYYDGSAFYKRFIIDQTGNVGINTANPTATLSVNGNADKLGGGTWAVFSDKRLKENVQPFNEGLAELLEINPVTFQYNGKAGIKSKEIYVGVIAQDIQKVLPHTVKEVKTLMNPEDPLSTENLLQFDPNALTYITINAIKELKQQNDNLKAENALMLKKLEHYSKNVEDLKTEFNKLKAEVQK